MGIVGVLFVEIILRFLKQGLDICEAFVGVVSVETFLNSFNEGLKEHFWGRLCGKLFGVS